jgi:hypothetical protein
MMVVRMQPELFSAIQKEAKKRKRTLREVILEGLEAHYERTPA